MFRTLFLIALVPAFAYAGTANVYNCGSDDNFPKEVSILGCDAAPCELHRGDVGVTHATMVVPHDIESFHPSVTAKVGFFVINYDLPDDVKEGCNWILEGGSCPLSEGTVVKYELRQEVDPASPTLFSPELTFNIRDEKNNLLFCWKWTANIV